MLILKFRAEHALLVLFALGCGVASAGAQQVAFLVGVSSSLLAGPGNFSVSSSQSPNPSEYRAGDTIRPDLGAILVVEYERLDEAEGAPRLLFIYNGSSGSSGLIIPEPAEARGILQSANMIQTSDSLKRTLRDVKKRPHVSVIAATTLPEDSLVRVLKASGFEPHPSFPDQAHLDLQLAEVVACSATTPTPNAATAGSSQPVTTDTVAHNPAQPMPGQPVTTELGVLKGTWTVFLEGQLGTLRVGSSKRELVLPISGEVFNVIGLEFLDGLFRLQIQCLPVRGSKKNTLLVGRVNEDKSRIRGVWKDGNTLLTWSGIRTAN